MEVHDDDPADSAGSSDEMTLVNNIYRILKTNQVLGQILRNKHGNLEIPAILEIVETVIEGGLKLINLVLFDENELTDFARFIATKHPKWRVERVRSALQFFTFAWVSMNLDQIVHSINVPELVATVQSIAKNKSIPAYELVDYFNQLDGAANLTQHEYDKLANFFERYNDPFVRRIASLRTQHYINTHRSEPRIEQSVCSLIGVRYVHRPVLKEST